MYFFLFRRRFNAIDLIEKVHCHIDLIKIHAVRKTRLSSQRTTI